MNKKIFNKIDTLVIDVDGVMTDGTKSYNTNGKIIAKKFNDRDFTAIKLFKMKNINVCFLSADKNVNFKVAKKRKIDFFYARNKNFDIDKSFFLKKIVKYYNSKKVIFVGDDIFDIPACDECDISCCTSDANPLLKRKVNFVLNSKGGKGAIQELYYLIFKN